MEKNIFEKEFELRISDFDCFDKIKPSVILDFFQDVAGEHADILSVGFNDLIKKDLIWVLVRTKYEIIKEPTLYSKIKVRTWPRPKGRIDFDRDYLILDENNNVLIKGTSKWVIVNYKTRRLSLTKDIDFNIEFYQEKNYLEPFNKLQDFELDDSFISFNYQTLFTDLDHNGHVNNIKYADMILNSINFNENDNIKLFEIDYIKELKKGNSITTYYKKENNIILIKGISEENNIYLAKIVLA